jgi:ABC-type polar amino acid transport system ATPase subunit
MAPGLVVLDVNGLRVVRGNRTVLENLSFSAAQGELVALMGPSGSGKSSVLRAIAGLDPFTGGTITVGGFPLTARVRPGPRSLRALHRAVGLVFQAHHLFAHMTALQNVWLAPVHVLRRPKDDAERRARALLERLGVAHRAGALPHELSGGEAQRVAIARALALDPPVLLMDEPTASLDAARRGDLAALVRGLCTDGTTVLVATHDGGFAEACDRIVNLQALTG